MTAADALVELGFQVGVTFHEGHAVDVSRDGERDGVRKPGDVTMPCGAA
jgi:hypothetical protein